MLRTLPVRFVEHATCCLFRAKATTLAARRLLLSVPVKSTVITAFLLAAIFIAQPSLVQGQESQSLPQDKKFGVGLMLGEPTGASLKYWLSDVSAIDGVVGISLDDKNNFAAHADYLYHLNDVIQLDQNRMPIYFGGGPRFKVRDGKDDLFGIRAVAGVAYIFDDIPVDVFVEAGPVFDVSPDFEVRYTVGVGARFWF